MDKRLLGLIVAIGILWSQISEAAGNQIVCNHYVVQNVPFCTVTLKILDGDKLEPTALINHQGQTLSSQLEELPLENGQLFHLNLDADKPGQEIEMIVYSSKNEKNEHKAVLINHQVPFGKEMQGICTE